MFALSHNAKKKLRSYVVLFVLCVGIVMVISLKQDQDSSVLVARRGTFEATIELALTPVSQIQGLSGREFLPKNQGLLFVFDKIDFYGFWMKDMLFSIDIIWLEHNTLGLVIDDLQEATIVHIEHDVSPDTYPESFIPLMPANMVLEVSAGTAREHNFEIGQKIFFEKRK